MLNIKRTLFNTIWNKIQNLRFLGQNNVQEFKSILSLIVVDDLYDWANYLGEPQSVQKFLKDWRVNHVLQNCFYSKDYSQEMFYTNVNIPQTDVTFRDVWDDQNVIYPQGSIPAPVSTCSEGWEPDPNYTPQLQYYYRTVTSIPLPPDLDPNNLTIHERMDVYINKFDNTVWVIPDGECAWQPLPVNNEKQTEAFINDYLESHPRGITKRWENDNIVISSALSGEAELESMTNTDITNLFNE